MCTVCRCVRPQGVDSMSMCAALTLCSALPPDCIRINCTASKWSSISPNSSPSLFLLSVYALICVWTVMTALMCLFFTAFVMLLHVILTSYSTYLCTMCLCANLCVCVCLCWTGEPHICVSVSACSANCRRGAVFAEGQGFSRSAILAKKDGWKRGWWGLEGK